MKKIAYIQAQWHEDITNNCKDEFNKRTKKLFKTNYFKVPGSLEIPLLAKKLAKTDKYLAIATSGFIVNGGIYRHEFVSSTVIDAIMQVQLETEIPILSAILTPINFHEHKTHLDFFKQHMKEKGVELANATIEIVKLYKNI